MRVRVRVRLYDDARPPVRSEASGLDLLVGGVVMHLVCSRTVGKSSVEGEGDRGGEGEGER